MKDARVTVFRKAVTDLIESLDAMLRVTRWASAEPIPDPLKDGAQQLVTRLGAADRLASANFTGSTADIARVTAMRGAMKRLDEAYVVYRQQLDKKPAEREAAALTLETDIDEVKAEVQRWE